MSFTLKLAISLKRIKFKKIKIANQLIKFVPTTNRVLIGHAKDKKILSFYKVQPNLVKDDPFKNAINEALRKTGLSAKNIISK